MLFLNQERWISQHKTVLLWAEYLNCREVQPVNPNGNQPWIFTGRTDAEAETPILWPPNAKNWLIWKDPDAGKDWGQEEKDDRGWDGWMASPTQCTWVWVKSRSRRWTRRPDVLQSIGSQRVGHDWVTELSWTEIPHRAEDVSILHSREEDLRPN